MTDPSPSAAPFHLPVQRKPLNVYDREFNPAARNSVMRLGL